MNLTQIGQRCRLIKPPEELTRRDKSHLRVPVRNLGLRASRRVEAERSHGLRQAWQRAQCAEVDVCRSPSYRKMYERKLKEKGSEEAAMRSAFAIYTQEIEDWVMEKVREYIWSQGIEIYSLIHDGLITSACTDELLRGIEDYIAQHGWDIRLAEKPLHGLQDAPIPELAPIY